MEENPYNAGFGAHPPYFAGRRYETKIIDRALNLIQGRAGPMSRSPSPAIVLLGPRGVGKTVLLGRTKVEALSRGIQPAVLTRSLLSGPQHELVGHIFPDGWIKNVFGKLKTLGVNVLGTGFQVGKKDAEKNFRSAMPAFLSKSPLLLILDEAHRCSPEALNLLFENIQVCIDAKLPLAVVLAGTPGLEAHLRECEVTYVERSEILRINTLSREESQEALELPATETNRPMKPGAVKLLMDWSDYYPFFIQMAGIQAWDASVERSGKDITVADAKQGLVLADKKRIGFYENRHDELRKRHVSEHAAQVVKILRDENGDMDKSEVELCLMNLNKGMDEDRAMEVVEILQELGFLWNNTGVIEPGIPSMFDFVLQKHRKLMRRKSRV